LLIVCLILAWGTRDAMARLPFLKSRNQAAAQNSLVDLRPWQTAEDLAAMAITAEEQEFAHEAEHLADHEVDQAFASALRQAQIGAQHRALQGEALTLSQKVAQLQKIVNDDQARVQSLTQKTAQNPTETTRSLSTPDSGNPGSDDLELAKAQLGLDSDELSDAQQDMARALGDQRGRIQQELAAHEAAMKKYEAQAATRGLGALATSQHYGTIAQRLNAWFDQRARYQMLEQAAQQASTDSNSLTTQHNQMEKQSVTKPDDAADRETRLNSMKSRSMHSQILSIYDDRIQTQQQLATVYRKWAAQVLLQHQIVFHLLMNSLALLAFILVCALFCDAFVRYLLQRRTLDRRVHSYRLISRLTIQVVSFVLILLVIFGTPSEMPTIVGLTTAGLTVVLQDFIISFCGWFILMGKNGIRVGDWVEINGVGGEVVNIGVFRTSLLETGNWTDHGHPTGRRVAFTNSFAIKGQYFNFTTTGQWMWDEITVTVPNSQDAYGTIELIHKAVLEQTAQESHVAEEEWMRLGRDSGLSHFSATASVNMRPSVGGIDILVRYVTRASTRYEVRNLIYQRVIELLHKREVPAVTTPA
jgi:small-conductance mechanosensitive channel